MNLLIRARLLPPYKGPMFNKHTHTLEQAIPYEDGSLVVRAMDYWHLWAVYHHAAPCPVWGKGDPHGP